MCSRVGKIRSRERKGNKKERKKRKSLDTSSFLRVKVSLSLFLSLCVLERDKHRRRSLSVRTDRIKDGGSKVDVSNTLCKNILVEKFKFYYFSIFNTTRGESFEWWNSFFVSFLDRQRLYVYVSCSNKLFSVTIVIDTSWFVIHERSSEDMRVDRKWKRVYK